MGIFYRVEKWSGRNPGEGIPLLPDISKATWRTHNQFDTSIIETKEVLVSADKPVTHQEKLGDDGLPLPIPPNGLGSWHVGDNPRATEPDPKAKDESWKTPAYYRNMVSMGNYAQGHDVPTIQAALKEILARVAVKDKLVDVKAEAVTPEEYLAARVVDKPLGMLINEDPAALCAFMRVCPVEPVLPKAQEEKAIQLIAAISPAQQEYDAAARAKVLEKNPPKVGRI